MNKLGKQIKQSINGFNSEIGTTNSQDNKCSYLLFTGYVKPIQGDLNKAFKRLETTLRFHLDDCISQLLSELINPNMPVIRILETSDTTMASSATRVNNRYTYFSLDVTLYFKDHLVLGEKDILDKLTLILYSIADLLEETPDLMFVASQPKKAEAVAL